MNLIQRWVIHLWNAPKMIGWKIKSLVFFFITIVTMSIPDIMMSQISPILPRADRANIFHNTLRNANTILPSKWAIFSAYEAGVKMDLIIIIAQVILHSTMNKLSCLLCMNYWKQNIDPINYFIFGHKLWKCYPLICCHLVHCTVI